MKTKTIFLWLLLALLVGGVNGAWANIYTVMFDNGATQSTEGWFTITGGGGYQSNYNGYYNDHTYEKGLKVGSTTDISFTTTTRSTVTIVQCVSRLDDGNTPLRFDGVYLTADDVTAARTDVYVEYTKSNVAAGLHHITCGDKQTGLFFVKVVEEDFTMEMNPDDMYYGNAAYVGTTFPYSSGVNSFRIKLNLNNVLESSDISTTHFTLTSSNSSVINTTYTVGAVSGYPNKIYYSVNVVGTGDVTLTFSYNGTGTYSNTASCTGTFHITDPTFTVFDTSNPSYPYTWDFENNDWTTSEIQVKNKSDNNDTWRFLSNEARPREGTSSVPANNGIDMISGLQFSSNTSSPCLDWTNKLLWLQSGTTITLPSLSAGQVITLNSTGAFATPIGTTKLGNNVFRVNSDATVVVLTVPSGDCYLYSIKISRAGQATYETTSGGVFQFTGTGSLDGGTVIKDVPGIEMKIGTVGNSYTVGDAGGYLNNSVGCGDSYVFTPKVNGFLTVNVWGTINPLRLYENGSSNVYDNSAGNINVSGGKTCVLTKPLKAGNTYSLSHDHDAVYLHSFSFEPAFLTTDKTAKQKVTYSVYPSETNFPMIVNGATSGVTFTSGTPATATVEQYGNGWPTYVATGSTTITATITSPNSEVNSKKASYTLQFNEANLSSTLTFANPSPDAIDYVTYGSDMTVHSTFTNAIVSSEPTEALTGATITYSSSNESIATVDGSGNLTIYNNGTVTITATMAAHGAYVESSNSYDLTINPTEDSEIRLQHYSTAEDPIEIHFGNTLQNKGVVWSGDVQHDEAWVNYTPSNTSYVSVENDPSDESLIKRRGTVNLLDMSDNESENIISIRAWSPAYKQYKAAEATYYIKIVQNNSLSLTFAPGDYGIINVGSSIIPYLGLSNVKGDRLGNLTAVSSDDTKATVTANLKDNWQLNDGYLHKLNPVMTGVAVTGENEVVTITVTLADSKYYKGSTASYKLKVTTSGTRNFSWNDATGEGEADIPEYKVYEDDFMIMPMIKGNSNSNNNYSNHSNNKYLYNLSPKKENPSSSSDFNYTWQTEDYRLNEGIPDFAILNASRDAVSDIAYILNCKGEGGRTGEKPDTLMIYALPLGASSSQTVYIRAYEPGNHEIYCDAKVTILPKSTLKTAHTANVDAISYPYTWDFTQDFAATPFEDKVYWEKTKGTLGNYSAGGGFFNIKSYAKPKDKTYDTKNANIYYQNFVGGGSLLPQFKGLMVSINGTSSWGNKVDRLQVTPAAGSGRSHLFFNGGYHELLLPDVSTSRIIPDNYKVFIKVKGSGSGAKITCIQGSSSDEKSFNTTEQVISFNATKTGGQVILRMNNVHVYWIAMSTEEKPVSQPTATTYPASTYSYTKALDLDKSEEVNSGLSTYYADYTSGTNTVVMRPLTGKVESETGLMLTLSGSPTSVYMIADPENLETYTSPTRFRGESPLPNYLIGTGNTAKTPNRFEREGSTITHTNYILTNLYQRIIDDEEDETKITPITGEGIYSDWKYVRTAGDIEVGANKAYLHLPNRLLNVDTTVDGSGGSSRGVMDIVFEDEITGVQNGVRIQPVDNSWYTLQGVRVTKPAKGGIYIHNGKKIAVK